MDKYQDQMNTGSTVQGDHEGVDTGSQALDNGRVQGRGVLPSFKTHLKESLDLMRSHKGVITFVTIVSIVVGAVSFIGFFMSAIVGGASALAGEGVSIAFISAVMAGSLLFAIITFWLMNVLFNAYLQDPEHGTLGDAIKGGSSTLFSFLWVYVLGLIVILGAGLLLVIPAIIAWILLSVSIPVLIAEKKSGWNALVTSREYLRGYAVSAALRYFGVGVIGAIINSIPRIMVESSPDDPTAVLFIGSMIIAAVVGLLITFFQFAFVVRMYQYLREVKSDVSAAVQSNSYPWLKTFLVLGVILIVMPMLLSIVFAV